MRGEVVRLESNLLCQQITLSRENSHISLHRKVTIQIPPTLWAYKVSLCVPEKQRPPTRDNCSHVSSNVGDDYPLFPSMKTQA